MQVLHSVFHYCCFKLKNRPEYIRFYIRLGML